MHKIAIATTLALCIAAFACSEADDGATQTFGVDAGNTGNSPADASTSSANNNNDANNNGASDSGASTPIVDGGSIATAIVVNEISGKGQEWIEIVNGGSAAIDLGGYGVTDREKEGGAPKMSDAVTFPSGTVLSPNSYLVVSNAPSDAGPDASPCPVGGQSYCIADGFGISNSEGDSVFVLDKAQNVIGQVDYPANVVASGQTWGRLPNVTGAFAVNQPTPGAVNKSP